MKSLLLHPTEPLAVRVLATLDYWRHQRAQAAPYRCACGCACEYPNHCLCGPGCRARHQEKAT